MPWVEYGSQFEAKWRDIWEQIPEWIPKNEEIWQKKIAGSKGQSLAPPFKGAGGMFK